MYIIDNVLLAGYGVTDDLGPLATPERKKELDHPETDLKSLFQIRKIKK